MISTIASPEISLTGFIEHLLLVDSANFLLPIDVGPSQIMYFSLRLRSGRRSVFVAVPCIKAATGWNHYIAEVTMPRERINEIDGDM